MGHSSEAVSITLPTVFLTVSPPAFPGNIAPRTGSFVVCIQLVLNSSKQPAGDADLFRLPGSKHYCRVGTQGMDRRSFGNSRPKDISRVQ